MKIRIGGTYETRKDGVGARLFDPACQDLAEHFLADEPFTRGTMEQHSARVKSLSFAIQVAVEDWLQSEPLEKLAD